MTHAPPVAMCHHDLRTISGTAAMQPSIDHAGVITTITTIVTFEKAASSC